MKERSNFRSGILCMIDREFCLYILVLQHPTNLLTKMYSVVRNEPGECLSMEDPEID